LILTPLVEISRSVPAVDWNSLDDVMCKMAFPCL